MSAHIKFLKKQSDIKTHDGQIVSIFKLDIENEKVVLDEWSKHLRNHYCLDSEIDFLRSGSGFPREKYLTEIKFPSPQIGIGSAVMSGDFAEILVHDYIEFVENFYVTRTRYREKVNRNSSTMGSDVLGYKCLDVKKPNGSDELIVLEVKAQSSETKPKLMLQRAVDHSAKDEIRLAESLNAEVQRLVGKNKYDEAKIVQRFQNKTDRPYRLKFAAVAVHSTKSYDSNLLRYVDTKNHPDSDLKLLVIYSDSLLDFIKKMYVRASKC